MIPINIQKIHEFIDTYRYSSEVDTMSWSPVSFYPTLACRVAGHMQTNQNCKCRNRGEGPLHWVAWSFSEGPSYPMQAVYLFQVGGVGPQESGALAGLAWKLIGGWNSCVSFACGLFPRVASSNGWLAFSCWSNNRSSRPDRWLVFISFAESSKAGWFFVRLRSNWVKMDKSECVYRATSDQIFIIDTLNNVSWGLPWRLDHLFLLTQCSLAWVAARVEGTSCLQAVLLHGETAQKNW